MDSGDNYRRWNVSQLDAIPSQLQVRRSIYLYCTQMQFPMVGIS